MDTLYFNLKMRQRLRLFIWRGSSGRLDSHFLFHHRAVEMAPDMGGPGQRAPDFLVAGAFDHRDLHCVDYRVLLLDCSCWSDGGDLVGFGFRGGFGLGEAHSESIHAPKTDIINLLLRLALENHLKHIPVPVIHKINGRIS